ncbi:MAG: HAMP domain-containing histidine kinase [Actinobacteria bacterium]|nr:MAG: HAMP domain-containing histidine kinase [Actinomycetota bacterium]
MRRLRPLVIVVGLCVFGALGTMAVGAALGMHAADLATLAAYLLPALALTVLAIALANRLLANVSLRQRFVVIAVAGTVVSLGNLFALTRAMAITQHDATLLATLLLYAAATGVGAAVAVSRSAAAGLGRLSRTAQRLGEGDLDARVGSLDAEPELEELARTMDEMADRLRSAQERERRAEATRNDLITAVSHDLRTPLASLRAMVEAIDEAVVRDPPTLGRYAAEMRRSVSQLSAMVNDLFELVQIDAGAIEAETARARVHEVVERAIATVEVPARDKGLTLVREIDGAADVACSPRLVRVLQTLLVNAVRHTPADGTVRVEARRTGGSLELTVQDTGAGILPADLARVFEPFFRADAARSGPGAGLGLALAKRIVEALGGRIEAASEPTRGARFAVSIPV